MACNAIIETFWIFCYKTSLDKYYVLHFTSIDATNISFNFTFLQNSKSQWTIRTNWTCIAMQYVHTYVFQKLFYEFIMTCWYYYLMLEDYEHFDYGIVISFALIHKRIY